MFYILLTFLIHNGRSLDAALPLRTFDWQLQVAAMEDRNLMALGVVAGKVPCGSVTCLTSLVKPMPGGELCALYGSKGGWLTPK